MTDLAAAPKNFYPPKLLTVIASLPTMSCSKRFGGWGEQLAQRVKPLWAWGSQLSFTQTRCVYISQSPAGVLQRLQLRPQGLAPAKLPARRLLLSSFFFLFQRRDSNRFAAQLNQWAKKESKKKRGAASLLVCQVRTSTSDVTKGWREKKVSRVRERVRWSGQLLADSDVQSRR